MTDVVRVIRQSQGAEDSISLQQQRENTRELASELGAESLHTIDLKNHSGFSRFRKSEDDERLDAHPEVQNLIAGLREEIGIFSLLTMTPDSRETNSIP